MVLLLVVEAVEKFGAYLSYNPEWQTLPPIRERLVFQDLQKTDSHTLTLVKSRLALGSPGCLFIRHHAENGPIHRKMDIACPLVITSKVKFFFRPNKTRKGE